jgi:hypothetical protein
MEPSGQDQKISSAVSVTSEGAAAARKYPVQKSPQPGGEEENAGINHHHVCAF